MELSEAHKQSVFGRFKDEKSGNVATLFAMSMIVVCGAVGGAIDYGRASHAQRKMQAATDAAAMAAATAKYATLAQRTQIAQQTFNYNNSGSFGTQPQLSVNIDSGAETVTATASSHVPATFMKVVGIADLPISTMSQVAAGTSGSGKQLEVAMMIDLTGSMGATRNGMTKIDALKLASTDLIDIFFPNNALTSGTTRVAIAPMADYVNAGPYASAVTGLPLRGPFNNLTNLNSTRHGPFSGSHTGSVTGGASGSQHGATSPLSAQAGATYNNGHCAVTSTPPGPVAQSTYGSTGVPVGVPVKGTGVALPQLMAPAGGYYDVDGVNNQITPFAWLKGGNSAALVSKDYYIPIPATVTGVTFMTDSATGKMIGVSASLTDTASAIPPQIKSASAEGGYLAITGYKSNAFTLASTVTNTGYFIPVPAAMTTSGGTLPECTSTNNPNDGYLVSCVTERPGASHRNDHASPSSGGFLGPFNQSASGSTNKLNYSEDGKCMTAGRELPAVIPLTNQRATIEDFFRNATIGGSTPGHLGHAWAWYMLSPEWNSIWPSESRAAEYSDATVMKAAIIMTDGEYNTQYSSETSKDQALALCSGMRAAGIKVFTIGFGFTSNAADTAAADTLKQCVNNEAGSYFLAYDGDALRQAFKDIGQQLTLKQKMLVFKQ